MLLLESQLRSIIKEELKKVLFENVDARADLKKYMKNLSKKSGIDLDLLKKLNMAIRGLVGSNTNSHYVDLIYNKPKKQITYGDVLEKLTTIFNLNTPLTFSGFSFSPDLNEPVKDYMSLDNSQQYYDSIALQFLIQNPSLNTETINSLISDMKKKQEDIFNMAQAKIKKNHEERGTSQTQQWDSLAAPEDALFNKFAFSPQRQGMESPPPIEANNPIEDEYLEAIKNHFAEDDLLSLEKAQKLKELMQSGLYSDIFKPPTQSVVYRGMTIQKEYLIGKLGLDANEFGEEPKTISRIVTFRQTRNALSWTTNFDIAKQFAIINGKRYTGDVYALVFEANVADNQGNLLDCDNLYDISDLEKFETENEVLSLGDIVCSKIYINKL